jgi:hypothetical protein
MVPKYPHIDENGIRLMEEIRPGALLRISWIEDPEADAEWGLDMIYFDEAEEENIVMLIEWMPYVRNTKNVITFKCLHEDKIYYSSTIAILEILV